MNKKKIVLIILSITGIIVLLLGITYAWYTLTLSGTKKQVIKVGPTSRLSLILDDEYSTAINLTNAIPLSDEQGVTQDEYTFSLESDGDTAINYDINLIYDEDAYTTCQANNEGIACKRLPLDGIRYKLVNITDNDVSGPATLTSNNKIYSGLIDSGVVTKYYSLQIWLDSTSDLNEIYQNAFFYGKIEVGATACRECVSDESGASTPELVNGMIPVRYVATNDTTGNWVKADATNISTNEDELWYKYDDQKWANAVLVNSAFAKVQTAKSVSINPLLSLRDIYKFTSGNQGVPSSTSSATIRFHTRSSGVLSFDYSVSSQASYDKLTITLNGTTIVNGISGSVNSSYSTAVTADTTYDIYVSYVKNASTNTGDDAGTISNISVTNNNVAPYIALTTVNRWTESITSTIYIPYFALASGYTYNAESGVFEISTNDVSTLNDTYLDYYFCPDFSSSCSTLYQIKAYSDNRIISVDVYSADQYSNGTVIPESSILAYFVWIPRFSYTIKSEDGTNYYGKTLSALGGSTASQTTPGAIDIKFVDKYDDIEDGSARYTGNTATNYYTHPAFCFGTLTEDDAGNTVAQGEKRTSCDDFEVNGFWMAKFETGTPTQAGGTVTACSDENCTATIPVVKPNYPALNNQTLGSMFYIARSMQETNYATYNLPSDGQYLHRPPQIIYYIYTAKNMEWGAVAYLSQSVYGKYGNPDYTGVNKEIYQNKSYKSGTITTLEALGISYTGDYSVTGNSNGTPSQSGYSTNQYAYNNLSSLGTGLGQAGPGASTTGNIYGVYDMSGGLEEYVMGNVRADGETAKVLNPSSSGLTASAVATKYFDSYLYGTTYNDAIAYARSLKGDAIKEMSPVSGYTWYGDYAMMPTGANYMCRGALSNSDNPTGMFSLDRHEGNANISYGFRLTIKSYQNIY